LLFSWGHFRLPNPATDLRHLKIICHNKKSSSFRQFFKNLGIHNFDLSEEERTGEGIPDPAFQRLTAGEWGT
jgi:hypothetical protein